MEILFAVLLALLIYLGWRSRKLRDQQWLNEERYEESGDWLDKRASERGTFGSLDAERESERRDLRREVKINQAAKIFEKFFTENSSKNFEGTTADDRPNRSDNFKTAARKFIELAEQTAAGAVPATSSQPDALPATLQILRKELLHFAYENYPQLLELEIETIQLFDRATGELVAGVRPSFIVGKP